MFRHATRYAALTQGYAHSTTSQTQRIALWESILYTTNSDVKFDVPND